MTPEERAMRFRSLLSEIEVGAERLRLGLEEDIVTAMLAMDRNAHEALHIALEVSNEALDKVLPDG